MTVEQLIKELQNLGEKHQNKEVIMADCAWFFTPIRVKVLDEEFGKNKGKVLID
jgi:hypothetical protein